MGGSHTIVDIRVYMRHVEVSQPCRLITSIPNSGMRGGPTDHIFWNIFSRLA